MMAATKNESSTRDDGFGGLGRANCCPTGQQISRVELRMGKFGNRLYLVKGLLCGHTGGAQFFRALQIGKWACCDTQKNRCPLPK